MAENIFYELLNQDSVFIDKTKISPHYTPVSLPFRNQEIKTLSIWLSPVLKKAKPHNIFIYGKVGTGKTTVVKHVIDNLLSCSKEHSLPLYTIYINCRNFQTKNAVLFYCVQHFFPNKNFVGYSKSFIYDKFLTYIKEKELNFIVVLDEVDKIKEREIDDLIYSLTRTNDELVFGSVSVVGISNNLFFKSKLDLRTKSSLCQQEAVFPPYDAEQLKEILKQRVPLAFKAEVVDVSAINAAAALSAKESGDARTAVMLLLRAGELADLNKEKRVTDQDVLKAKAKVESEIIKSMVLTLPVQLQLVLLAISEKSLSPKAILKITGQLDSNVLYSGEVYEKYEELCKKYSEKVVSTRWFREYINELETYGFITTTVSGKGVKGNTTLIKLGFDAKNLANMIVKEFSE